MKAWLKDKVPFPLKLALKRQRGRIRALVKRQGQQWIYQPPDVCPDDSLDFQLVEQTLAATPSPVRSQTQTIKTSLIIPVFNRAQFTFQCLRSLLAEINFAETEIIVVNNASTDETSKLLTRFKDFLEVIENRDNLGSVDACNQGVTKARGKYLLFPKNDTVVLPGWLDALVKTVDGDPTIGAVGSLFLFPDARVQEAGTIIWNDGNAAHYGRGGLPDDPRFRFARDVDSCSGASLLIRKDLFEKLGGFDRRYAPAYYEDVDLCFGVRSLGYRVVFQPASRIIHYEGVNAGRDVNSGPKRYQVVNQAKFSEKWKDLLGQQHLAKNRRNFERAAHRIPQTAVVVFDDLLPTPDLDAGSARMANILRILRRRHRTLFVYKSKNPSERYEQALWTTGVETLDLVNYRQRLRDEEFQTAVVSRPDLAYNLVPSLRRLSPKMKIIYDPVDAHYRRLDREYQLLGDPNIKNQAERYRRIELELVRTTDMLWSSSVADAKLLTTEVPEKPVAIIPTIHPLHPRVKRFTERQDLIFIGNFNHRPNSDAISFFIEQVLPLIRRSTPEVGFDIVGSNTPASFQLYASESLRIHGYVPDIDPLFNSSRVFVAPLRFGAGVNGKIGEALSYGLPVVTTDIGAEGLGLENGKHALIANSPDEFAAAVIRLYEDRDLWERLSDVGYEHIAKHFSPETVERTILESVG